MKHKEYDFIEPCKTYKPGLDLIECPFCGEIIDDKDEECFNCCTPVWQFFEESEINDFK